MSTAPIPYYPPTRPGFADPNEPGTQMVVNPRDIATSTMDPKTPPPPMDKPIFGLPQKIAIVPAALWNRARHAEMNRIIHLFKSDVPQATIDAQEFNADEIQVAYEWR